MRWLVKPFSNLTNDELYAILRLRCEIFAVEQKIVYQDCDNYDQRALHVMGWQDDELMAYARVFGPGIKYADCAIGRVATSGRVRGQGIGRILINHCLDACEKYFPASGITLSAQAYLEKFYHDHGFVSISEPYIEEDILHIKMQRKAKT